MIIAFIIIILANIYLIISMIIIINLKSVVVNVIKWISFAFKLVANIGLF